MLLMAKEATAAVKTAFSSLNGTRCKIVSHSPLENHDEEGVISDPRFGENNTFYLQAIATLPTVQNDVELENYLLDSLRQRAIAAGFEFLSTLIEDRLRDTGPEWIRSSAILERNENYLRSGRCFAYLQVALQPATESRPAPQVSALRETGRSK